jgi:hypothetical protein
MDRVVHLRDGAMMELVVPTIRKGGVNTVYVMVGDGLLSIGSLLLIQNLILYISPI